MKQMQRIVCLVALLLSFFSLKAQKKPMSIFEPQWTEIEKSLANGRTKDAVNLANQTLEKARKTGSDADVMRTLLYVANLQKVEGEEVDSAPNIVLLEKELASAKMPLKAMLESYTAQAYSQYYSNKRWQIDQRTAVSAGHRHLGW
jgi:predicted RND superfamily exporter protein